MVSDSMPASSPVPETGKLRRLQHPSRVLVVDDSEDDREFMERLLKSKMGLSGVDLAACGAEAFPLAKQADCVLLDYHLGIEDGLVVLQKILEEHPFLPVIMLTGQGSETIAVKAMQLGAMDYIVKDKISVDSMERAISTAIDRSDLRGKLSVQAEEQEHFLRSMVHDFSAPLRHIGILAEYLKDDAEESSAPDLIENAQAIMRASERATGLLTALRDYAMMGRSIALEPVPLEPLVADIAAMHNVTLPTPQVTYDALPTVMGSPPELSQLLQNLVGNGLKYSTAEIPAVHVSASSDDRSHLINVDDNGPGIPQDRLTDVFKPFTRLHGADQVDGTGLGLAICRRITERHRGALRAENRPEGGCRFVFTIPKNPQEEVMQ